MKLSKEVYVSVIAVCNISSVIINDGYASNAEVVYAANHAGRKTIEVQHGIISKGHFATPDPYADCPDLIPDTLVCWQDNIAESVAWISQSEIEQVEFSLQFPLWRTA